VDVGADDEAIDARLPKKLLELNAIVLRSSWIAWWVQLVLSVISSVILTFANTVRTGGGLKTLWGSGFMFSVVGAVVSFINTFWTWNFTRLARRVTTGKIDQSKIVPSYRKYAKTSVFLSLLGMLVTLFGAEQIVGGLASKALLNQGSFIPVATAGGAVAATSQLQALDIFLVQANTNLLVSHYAPLAIYLWVQTLQPIARATTQKLQMNIGNEAMKAGRELGKDDKGTYDDDVDGDSGDDSARSGDGDDDGAGDSGGSGTEGGSAANK
jgi:hypothetical protein